MKRLTIVTAALALALGVSSPAAQADHDPVTVGPITVHPDHENQCPHDTVKAGGIHTDSGFWTQAGTTCQMSLDGATRITGSINELPGVPNADGELVGSVALTIMDNNTGLTIASCVDTTAKHVTQPGIVTGIASCGINVVLDAPTDLDVTVTAFGTGAGRYGARLE